MLPDAFAVDEVGGSWRLLETAGVLSVWGGWLVVSSPSISYESRRDVPWELV